LPGFPDGSFGWAKVDQQLNGNSMMPKLYVEYVGQGDSDKPSGYSYGTMERADLVEALWEAEGIQSTFVVTFDYSSLVVLELLSRQEERLNQGIDSCTKIKGVLMANGGYFADAHSHPLMTTPALRSPLGGIVTWFGQRSPFMSRQLLKSMFSKEYRLTTTEFNEIYDAISRRNGFSFVSRAAGFVAEHRAEYGERWDLRRLYLALRESVSFHIVGSEGDIFEPNQVVKARERLGDQGLDIRMLPGGHMITSEQPDQFARIIEEVRPSIAAV
jgi:pimeloyl-ACP methyl ester carboxylesterase